MEKPKKKPQPKKKQKKERDDFDFFKRLMEEKTDVDESRCK